MFINVILYFSFFQISSSFKLYSVDSLVVLYILSSNVYTVGVLLIGIFLLLYKLRTLTLFSSVAGFVVGGYFITKHPYMLYITPFLKTIAVNITLQNGLLNIHPSLIYFIYINIIVLFTRTYSNYCSTPQMWQTTTYLYRLSLYAFLGIYLGAVWANQELNWGGFWSWDPVEIVSLLVALRFIFMLHSRETVFFNNPLIRYISAPILVYVVIRVGVITTIHSFVRSTTIPYYIVIIYYSLLYYVVLFLINYKLCKKYFGLFLQVLRFHKLTIAMLYYYSIFYLVILICSAINLLPPNYTKINVFWNILFLGLIIFISIHVYLIQYYIPFFTGLVLISMSILTHRIFVGVIIYVFLLYSIPRIYQLKHPVLHVTISFIYYLFFLFFINIPTYQSDAVCVSDAISINMSSTTAKFTTLYEISFTLKKWFFFFKLKNLFSHISGFNILTNQIWGTSLFLKNFSVRYLFGMEGVYLISILCGLGFLFGSVLLKSNNTPKQQQYY